MVAKVARTTGELLITAGLVLLLFVAYVLWGTGVQTARAQNSAENRLEASWRSGGVLPGETQEPAGQVGSGADPAGSPSPQAAGSSGGAAPSKGSAPGRPAAAPANIPLGAALARLYIPQFGGGYQWVIGEGVSHEDLKTGPGHYPGTALPGQIGNFVVSGHRTTYGAPFGGLGELPPGAAIVVETAKSWYTYRLRSSEIVDPTQVSVTLAVPNQPGAAPTEALMTFTTCHPKYSAKQRLILYSVLESTLLKSAGVRPTALGAA